MAPQGGVAESGVVEHCQVFINCTARQIGRQAVLIGLQARGNPAIVRARELWRSDVIERMLIVRVISPTASSARKVGLLVQDNLFNSDGRHPAADLVLRGIVPAVNHEDIRHCISFRVSLHLGCRPDGRLTSNHCKPLLQFQFGFSENRWEVSRLH
jgi:hypothetical protein